MTLRNTLLSGLTAIVLASSVAGCSVEEKRSGAEYNRIVYMPEDCKTPISAGSDNRYTRPSGKHAQESTTNYDWIACQDNDGSVTVYRMHKGDNQWYSTRMDLPTAEKNF